MAWLSHGVSPPVRRRGLKYVEINCQASTVITYQQNFSEVSTEMIYSPQNKSIPQAGLVDLAKRVFTAEEKEEFLLAL